MAIVRRTRWTVRQVVVKRRRGVSYRRNGWECSQEGSKSTQRRARERHEERKEKVETRSRAVTSHTWNRVTMASGLLTLPCPPTPITDKVRLNVTYGFVSQPRAPGLLGFLQLLCLQCALLHHPPPAPGGPWSCERGHSTPEVDLILPHSGLSLGRPRHLIDGPGGLEVERMDHAGLGLTPVSGTVAGLLARL